MGQKHEHRYQAQVPCVDVTLAGVQYSVISPCPAAVGGLSDESHWIIITPLHVLVQTESIRDNGSGIKEPSAIHLKNMPCIWQL